jgi:hypothetical protein
MDEADLALFTSRRADMLATMESHHRNGIAQGELGLYVLEK